MACPWWTDGPRCHSYQWETQRSIRQLCSLKQTPCCEALSSIVCRTAIHFVFIYAIISQRHHIWQEPEKENKKQRAQYAGYFDQLPSPIIGLICPTLYWSHVYAKQVEDTVQQTPTNTMNCYSIWSCLM